MDLKALKSGDLLHPKVNEIGLMTSNAPFGWITEIISQDCIKLEPSMPFLFLGPLKCAGFSAFLFSGTKFYIFNGDIERFLEEVKLENF